MPVDLYQWEAAGGLVHHCPKCFKPLTTPQARSRCLGQHVEWCRRYHTQLFKKGSSGQCLPCRHSDEQHQRRHREVAELVNKLNLLNADSTSATTLSPHACGTPDSEEPVTPKTKKERKAAKKARKTSVMPKAVNAATVEHVGRVLHANDHEAEDGELEHELLNDADIKENRIFHKGTSNIRNLRNQFVKKDRKGDKVVFRVEAEELDGLLQLLNVSPVTAATSPEEKKIIDELKSKIEKDLVQVQEEQDGLMMRKAGFWRWASKKAYNRLMANGRIWEDKGDDLAVAKSDESAGSTEGDVVFSADLGDVTDDTNVTEPDIYGADEMAESVSTLILTTPKTPKTPKVESTAVEGVGEWTSVSKPKTKGSAKSKKAASKMTIKLSTNGGLAKMVQSSTPRSTGFLRYHSDDS